MVVVNFGWPRPFASPKDKCAGDVLEVCEEVLGFGLVVEFGIKLSGTFGVDGEGGQI